MLDREQIRDILTEHSDIDSATDALCHALGLDEGDELDLVGFIESVESDATTPPKEFLGTIEGCPVWFTFDNMLRVEVDGVLWDVSLRNIIQSVEHGPR